MMNGAIVTAATIRRTFTSLTKEIVLTMKGCDSKPVWRVTGRPAW